jgi:ribosome-binding factor A
VRARRLEELIREEVNFVLSTEIEDPRLDGVRVSYVELTPDGACARVWFRSDSPAASRSDEQVRALERATGFLRARVADGVALKRTPELRFRRDPAEN